MVEWKFDTGFSLKYEKANMRLLQVRKNTRLCNVYAPFSLPTQLRASQLTKSKEEGWSLLPVGARPTR